GRSPVHEGGKTQQPAREAPPPLIPIPARSASEGQFRHLLALRAGIRADLGRDTPSSIIPVSFPRPEWRSCRATPTHGPGRRAASPSRKRGLFALIISLLPAHISAI